MTVAERRNINSTHQSNKTKRHTLLSGRKNVLATGYASLIYVIYVWSLKASMENDMLQAESREDGETWCSKEV